MVERIILKQSGESCYHSAVDLGEVEDVMLTLKKDVIQRRQVIVTLPQIIQDVDHRIVVVDGSSP